MPPTCPPPPPPPPLEPESFLTARLIAVGLLGAIVTGCLLSVTWIRLRRRWRRQRGPSAEHRVAGAWHQATDTLRHHGATVPPSATVGQVRRGLSGTFVEELVDPDDDSGNPLVVIPVEWMADEELFDMLSELQPFVDASLFGPGVDDRASVKAWDLEASISAAVKRRTGLGRRAVAPSR